LWFALIHWLLPHLSEFQRHVVLLVSFYGLLMLGLLPVLGMTAGSVQLMHGLLHRSWYLKCCHTADCTYFTSKVMDVTFDVLLTTLLQTAPSAPLSLLLARLTDSLPRTKAAPAVWDATGQLVA